MLRGVIFGVAALLLLLTGIAVASAYFECLVVTLATYLSIIIGLYVYARSLKPTRSLLQKDLRRLADVVKVDEFYKKDYDARNVISYYSHTTFRDYKLLAVTTGTNAMHSELVPARRLPYKCGHMKQILYVMTQLGDGVSGGKVLEVGFGKGTNSVYLADLFPSASFMGIDLVPEHVAYANDWARSLGLGNATFIQDDASSPSVSGLFDLMFGIESFCHVDTTEKLQGFLSFAKKQLRPGGKLVVVDGFRGKAFEQLPEDVQQAMMLAESGFRIRRMASKATWESLAAAAGLTLVDSTDLTQEALAFWTRGWKVSHTLLTLLPWAVRSYIRRGGKHAETGANFVSVATTAYAMALGSAEYGVLVFKKA